MYLDAAKKQEIFEKYGKSNTDTGSAEAQIALFSYRISHLTEHLKLNRKDYSTERALTTLVGKRRALLNYLKNRDIERYRAIVKALGLRKESNSIEKDLKKSRFLFRERLFYFLLLRFYCSVVENYSLVG